MNEIQIEYEFPFVDKVTGEKMLIKASDSTLATLRAWSVNKNLTFDVSAVNPCINGMIG